MYFLDVLIIACFQFQFGVKINLKKLDTLVVINNQRPSFSETAVEVSVWINNHNPLVNVEVITYPYQISTWVTLSSI